MMKVASGHLEELRVLLLEKTAALDVATKALKAVADQRDALVGEVRLLQGGFDIFAAAFAQDSELSKPQLDSLPASAQQVLQYTPTKAAPAAV
jgi:hypothetical protein